MSHLASLIPKAKGMAMAMRARTMTRMSPVMAFIAPHPWLLPSFASRSIAPMSSAPSPLSPPTPTNHHILLNQHQVQLQQQQHQRRTFHGSGFCLLLATGDGTKGNPDNDAEIRDTNDETDEAQAAPTIPTDISEYESTFRAYKFWKRNTSNEDVKDMLNRSVLKSGEPTGALWDPLIATRKNIIKLVKDDLSTPSELQSFARTWLSDETNPLGRWLADKTLFQRPCIDSWYINADYVWRHIKELRMAWHDEQTLRKFILNELSAFQISHVDTVAHDRDYRCPSFFMGNPKFHHDGSDGWQSHEVVLHRQSLEYIDNQVFVYTSGSGSGRTTELAANAFLRWCVISIVTTADKDISSDVNSRQQSEECEEKLKALLDKAIEENPMALRVIMKAMNDWMEPRASDGSRAKPDPVRIVFCIDDARDCPNLIQEIIDRKEDMGEALGRYIRSGCDGKLGGDCKTYRRIKVMFSVVGTGQYGTSNGSFSKDYECFTPNGHRLNKTSSSTAQSPSE